MTALADKFTDKQVAVGGLIIAVGAWYLLRKLGNVAEQAIDAAVDGAKTAATAPMAATNPEAWGLRDDSTTFGTRAWFAQTLEEGNPFWRETVTDGKPAPDLVFNDNSDIPGVL